MPYAKQTHKLLSAGLNLVAPLDLTPEAACIACSNFRADSVGSLRSRPGNAAATTTLAAAIHSMITGIGHRYHGSSTNWYRDGSSIEGSFDSNPLGLAAFQKAAWAMNRSKQRYDNGSADFQWGITAPAAAPTVAVASELTTAVEGFESAASWGSITSGLTLSDEATIKIAGSNSLQGDTTAPGVYSFLKTGLTLNLNSVGGQTGAATDKFRIYLQLDKPKALNSITLYVAVETSATFSVDYYRCRIQKKKWKNLSGWVTLEIDRQQQSDDTLAESVNALYFERVGSTAGRDWSTVTGLKIEFEVGGDTGCTAYLDAWDVFGSEQGTIEGDIEYCYTYVNAAGHESNPSPISTALRFNRRRGSVTVVASADAQVTGINIYRNTVDGFYLVNTTPEANTNHTYTDTSSQADILLNKPLEDDNDLPPAASGLLGPFFGRLIAWSTAANPNRYFWSKLNQPFAFPGAASDLEGNWNDIGDSGYPILAATHDDAIINFYKQDGIWRVIGDPDGQDGVVQRASVPFGTVGQYSVCRTPYGDAFLGPDGIYLFNGDSARKISQKIDPLFKGIAVTLATGISKAAVTTTAANRAKAALGYFQGQLWFSYCETGQSTNNATLKYDFETDTWVEDSRGFALFYDEAGTFFGVIGVSTFILESGTADGASAIPLIYERSYDDFNIPDALKTVEDIVIEADTGGATLTLTGYKDNGTALTIASNTFSTSAGTRTKFTFQLDAEGEGVQLFNLSIRITGNANTSNPAILYGIFAHHYPEARNANSYDTDESLLGSPQVKLIRQIKLDIDNPNDATARVYTDLPGNAMALRDTLDTITGSASGRRMITRMIDAQYSAYLGRLVVDSSAMRVYGAYAEVKDIGDYVVANELWSSDEIDLGSSKVKGLRSVKFDIQSTDTVVTTLYSDVPEGILTARTLGDIGSTAGVRRIFEVPLSAEVFGRLFKLTLSSAADFIIYGVEFETREIGTYINGAVSKIWDSGILDFGTERVKLYKELQFDISCSATVTVTLLTDQPGGTLTSRLTSGNTIATTSGNRKTAKLPLPDGIKGRLLQVKAATSATDFILEAVRVWIKMIGEPNASPWTWRDLPLERTAQGVWTWADLPVVKTGSNEWRWESFGRDAVQ